MTMDTPIYCHSHIAIFGSERSCNFSQVDLGPDDCWPQHVVSILINICMHQSVLFLQLDTPRFCNLFDSSQFVGKAKHSSSHVLVRKDPLTPTWLPIFSSEIQWNRRISDRFSLFFPWFSSENRPVKPWKPPVFRGSPGPPRDPGGRHLHGGGLERVSGRGEGQERGHGGAEAGDLELEVDGHRGFLVVNFYGDLRVMIYGFT